MSKKIFICTVVAAMVMGALSGCGKKSSSSGDTASQSNSINITESSLINNDTASIILSKDGKILDDLSGEWIDASNANKRPIAIMINNLEPAMPQSGIGQADLIYEMEVEGGITRLMAVFKDYSNLSKIGPVRSARHYFDRTAMGLDAIYVHVGQSYLAKSDFDSFPQLDDINGLYEQGFYRDPNRVAPHNCYISTDGINQEISADGYSATHSSDYQTSFQFNSKDVVPSSSDSCTEVTTAFNESRKPWFIYNKNDGLYYRYQYGEAQMDDQTNSQLAFKNIIIQFNEHGPVPNEDVLIDINLNGTGNGYYISDGKSIPITWKRDGDTSPTRYYTADGKQLKMNPGKTWVTVFRADNTKGIIFNDSNHADSSASNDTAE